MDDGQQQISYFLGELLLVGSLFAAEGELASEPVLLLHPDPMDGHLTVLDELVGYLQDLLLSLAVEEKLADEDIQGHELVGQVVFLDGPRVLQDIAEDVGHVALGNVVHPPYQIGLQSALACRPQFREQVLQVVDVGHFLVEVFRVYDQDILVHQIVEHLSFEGEQPRVQADYLLDQGQFLWALLVLHVQSSLAGNSSPSPEGMAPQDDLLDLEVNPKVVLHEALSQDKVDDGLDLLDSDSEIPIPELEQVILNLLGVVNGLPLAVIDADLIEVMVDGDDRVAHAGPVGEDGRVGIHVRPKPMREDHDLPLVPCVLGLMGGLGAVQVGAVLLGGHVDLVDVGHDELEDGVGDPPGLGVHMEDLVEHLVVLLLGDPLDALGAGERGVEQAELQLVRAMLHAPVAVPHQVGPPDGHIDAVDLEGDQQEARQHDDGHLQQGEAEHLQQDDEEEQGSVGPGSLDGQAQPHQDEGAGGVGELVQLQQQLQVEEDHGQLLQGEQYLAHNSREFYNVYMFMDDKFEHQNPISSHNQYYINNIISILPSSHPSSPSSPHLSPGFVLSQVRLVSKWAYLNIITYWTMAGRPG